MKIPIFQKDPGQTPQPFPVNPYPPPATSPALPVDRQHAAHDGHPHDAHGAGHAHVEGAEVQRGQEEAEGAFGTGRSETGRRYGEVYGNMVVL